MSASALRRIVARAHRPPVRAGAPGGWLELPAPATGRGEPAGAPPMVAESGRTPHAATPGLPRALAQTREAPAATDAPEAASPARPSGPVAPPTAPADAFGPAEPPSAPGWSTLAARDEPLAAAAEPPGPRLAMPAAKPPGRRSARPARPDPGHATGRPGVWALPVPHRGAGDRARSRPRRRARRRAVGGAARRRRARARGAHAAPTGPPGRCGNTDTAPTPRHRRPRRQSCRCRRRRRSSSTASRSSRRRRGPRRRTRSLPCATPGWAPPATPGAAADGRRPAIQGVDDTLRKIATDAVATLAPSRRSPSARSTRVLEDYTSTGSCTASAPTLRTATWSRRAPAGAPRAAGRRWRCDCPTC